MEPAPTLERELAAIRSAIERNMRELSVLINDGNNRRMTRAAGELGAAVEGMEHVHGIHHPEHVRHLVRAQRRRDQRTGGPFHRALGHGRESSTGQAPSARPWC